MGTPLLLLLGLLPLFVGPNWAASNAASQTSLQSASSGETTAVANSNPTVSLFTFVSAGLTFGEPANAFADYIPNSHLDVDHHALWQPWSSAMSVSMNASTTSSNDGSVGIGSEMITSPLVGPINDETSKRLSPSFSPFAFDDPFEDASAALDAWRQKQDKHGIGAHDTDHSNSAAHGKLTSLARLVSALGFGWREPDPKHRVSNHRLSRGRFVWDTLWVWPAKLYLQLRIVLMRLRLLVGWSSIATIDSDHGKIKLVGPAPTASPVAADPLEPEFYGVRPATTSSFFTYGAYARASKPSAPVVVVPVAKATPAAASSDVFANLVAWLWSSDVTIVAIMLVVLTAFQSAKAWLLRPRSHCHRRRAADPRLTLTARACRSVDGTSEDSSYVIEQDVIDPALPNSPPRRAITEFLPNGQVVIDAASARASYEMAQDPHLLAFAAFINEEIANGNLTTNAEGHFSYATSAARESRSSSPPQPIRTGMDEHDEEIQAALEMSAPIAFSPTLLAQCPPPSQALLNFSVKEVSFDLTQDTPDSTSHPLLSFGQVRLEPVQIDPSPRGYTFSRETLNVDLNSPKTASIASAPSEEDDWTTDDEDASGVEDFEGTIDASASAEDVTATSPGEVCPAEETLVNSSPETLDRDDSEGNKSGHGFKTHLTGVDLPEIKTVEPSETAELQESEFCADLKLDAPFAKVSDSSGNESAEDKSDEDSSDSECESEERPAPAKPIELPLNSWFATEAEDDSFQLVCSRRQRRAKQKQEDEAPRQAQPKPSLVATSAEKHKPCKEPSSAPKRHVSFAVAAAPTPEPLVLFTREPAAAAPIISPFALPPQPKTWKGRGLAFAPPLDCEGPPRYLGNGPLVSDSIPDDVFREDEATRQKGPRWNTRRQPAKSSDAFPQAATLAALAPKPKKRPAPLDLARCAIQPPPSLPSRPSSPVIRAAKSYADAAAAKRENEANSNLPQFQTFGTSSSLVPLLPSSSQKTLLSAADSGTGWTTASSDASLHNPNRQAWLRAQKLMGISNPEQDTQPAPAPAPAPPPAPTPSAEPMVVSCEFHDLIRWARNAKDKSEIPFKPVNGHRITSSRTPEETVQILHVVCRTDTARQLLHKLRGICTTMLCMYTDVKILRRPLTTLPFDCSMRNISYTSSIWMMRLDENLPVRGARCDQERYVVDRVLRADPKDVARALASLFTAGREIGFLSPCEEEDLRLKAIRILCRIFSLHNALFPQVLYPKPLEIPPPTSIIYPILMGLHVMLGMVEIADWESLHLDIHPLPPQWERTPRSGRHKVTSSLVIWGDERVKVKVDRRIWSSPPSPRVDALPEPETPCPMRSNPKARKAAFEAFLKVRRPMPES